MLYFLVQSLWSVQLLQLQSGAALIRYDAKVDTCSVFCPSPLFTTAYDLFTQQRVSKEDQKQIRQLSFTTVKVCVCVQYLLHSAFKIITARTVHEQQEELE